MRRFLPLLMVLASCASGPKPAEVVKVPGPTRYVRVDPKLTAHPPLPPEVTTTPLQCPAVANDRLDLLRSAYRALDAIDAIEGTPVPGTTP